MTNRTRDLKILTYIFFGQLESEGALILWNPICKTKISYRVVAALYLGTGLPLGSSKFLAMDAAPLAPPMAPPGGNKRNKVEIFSTHCITTPGHCVDKRPSQDHFCLTEAIHLSSYYTNKTRFFTLVKILFCNPTNMTSNFRLKNIKYYNIHET